MALSHDPVILVCAERKCINIAIFPEATVDNDRRVFEELCIVEFIVRLHLSGLTGQANEEYPGLRRAVGIEESNQVRTNRRVSGNGGF